MSKSLYTYCVGFGLSLMLTLVAAALAWQHRASHHQVLSHKFLAVAFVVLAVLQLLAQLYFFLHLGEEKRPRWHSMALYFALMVVAILVGGTLWIMHNLSHGQSHDLPFIEHTVDARFSND